MQDKESIKIVFWGVRGSRPVPGPSTIKYGGDTACVEIQAGDRLVILDAGTGICNLGETLSAKGAVGADIFFSHLHWDHVQGLPFFSPLYQKGSSFNIYGEGKLGIPFFDVLRQQISPPSFPVSPDDFRAAVTFREIGANQTIPLSESVTVRTLRVNHPNGCLAYRVEYNNKAACYLTDIEHDEQPGQEILEFVRGAKVIIYDAQYTQDEYLGKSDGQSKSGWGHSTWQEGIKLVREAGGGKLILFHHDPERTDDKLELLEKEAALVYKDLLAAKEGMVLWL